MEFLNNIKVSKKLLATSVFTVAVLVTASIWLQYSTNRALLDATQEVEQIDALIASSTQWAGLTDATVQRVLVTALSAEPDVVARFEGQVGERSALIGKLSEGIQQSLKRESDKAEFAKITEARQRVLADVKKLNELKAAYDGAASQKLIDASVMPDVATYLKRIDDFIAVQKQHREEAKASAMSTQRGAQWLGVVVIAVVALGSLGWSAFVARTLVRPLERAVRLAHAIANGDLSQHIAHSNRRDEIGALLSALQLMNTKLRELVSQVRNGVDSVQAASTEIAAGNLDLSSRTEQTAANLQQAAASVEQLTGTVTHTAESAQQASALASAAADTASRGHAVVDAVISQMGEIKNSSGAIAGILGTIDSIAFQTNILALNAAVEAARAGEQGRGFAVVASEVRALASRSAEAAKQIKGLIAASTEKVESGSAMVAQTGQVMSDLVQSVKRATDMMNEIAAAAHEQREGITQVNQAVTQLDEMTQQNAALVEQSAAAAAALREQASQLSTLVDAFNVGRVEALRPAQAAVPAAAPPALAPAATARKSRPVRASAAPLTPSAKTTSQADDWETF